MHVHVACVLGEPGSGKTTILERIVERGLARQVPFVIDDQFGHWTARRGRVIRPRPGLWITTFAEGEAFAAHALGIARRLGGVTALLDEGGDYFPQGGARLPEGSALREIVRKGRQSKALEPWARRGPVSLVVSAQRPVMIHPEVRAAAGVFILLRMHERLDLDWVAETPGLGSKIAARLPSLPTFGYVKVRTR